jgi:hypothetical protein
MVSVEAEQKFVMPVEPASRSIPGPNTNTAMDSGMRRMTKTQIDCESINSELLLLETKDMAK